MATEHDDASQPFDGLAGRAELLVAMTAPLAWFNDPHGPGQHPRCCELRDAIVALVKGMIEDAR